MNDKWKEFAAIVGLGKIQTSSQWQAYARVMKLYPGRKDKPGYPWNNMLQAAQLAEPEKRWPQDLEQLLRNKARSLTSAY